MFERYSERARRAIFFARYEAAQLRSHSIDTEHLLLGVLREGAGAVSALLERHAIDVAGVRQKLSDSATREDVAVPASVDIPLSPVAQRMLLHASEEAERLGHEAIGIGHLLLGILREGDTPAARVLIEAGLTLEDARSGLVAFIASRKAAAAPDAPAMDKLLRLLEAVQERGFPYRLTHAPGNAIRVELTRQGERWEVDFRSTGQVEVRMWTQPPIVEGEEALKRLFDRDS